jgi:hypothetical protein
MCPIRQITVTAPYPGPASKLGDELLFGMISSAYEVPMPNPEPLDCSCGI